MNANIILTHAAFAKMWVVGLKMKWVEVCQRDSDMERCMRQAEGRMMLPEEILQIFALDF